MMNCETCDDFRCDLCGGDDDQCQKCGGYACPVCGGEEEEEHDTALTEPILDLGSEILIAWVQSGAAPIKTTADCLRMALEFYGGPPDMLWPEIIDKQPPWSEGRRSNLDVEVEASRPPCESCAHYRPMYQLRVSAAEHGFIACHAEEMQPDFSCFEGIY